MKERIDNRDDLVGTDELDQLVLDRLVDDDLSDAEYRKVLRLVEEKPDGWRKLAVAFLESQAFEKEMSALHLKSDRMPSEQANQQSLLGSGDCHDPDVEPSSPKRVSTLTAAAQQSTSLDSGSRWSRRLRAALPAIAAGIAVAFITGLYLQELQNGKQRVSAGGDGTNQSRTENSTVDPEYIELVSNKADRVKAPVYNHDVFDPATFADDMDHLAPKIQQAVNRPGWKTNERTHMMPIRDRTGNQIILPLKEIKLTPSSLEGYQ